MNNFFKFNLTHSDRRPEGQSWRASSCGHTTYAASREAVIEKHRDVIDVYSKIGESIAACADYTGKSAKHK